MLFLCMLVIITACTLNPFALPTPTLVPTDTPWRTGTPQPLFSPLTTDCLGQTLRDAFDTPRHTATTHDVSYGMNVFLFGTDMERVLTLTDSTGVAWIRQQIHWRDIEGERGQYVWTPLDQIVNAARVHHLHIMLSIVRSPVWATNGGHAGIPEDTAPFATFLRQAATRYRGRVSAYEIWNEPNLSHENGGTPGDPATYLALLTAAYPAIKAADPCALVVAAPLAATNNPNPTTATPDIPFYEELYTLNNGAFLHVADAVAVHPGAGPHPPAAYWQHPDESHYYFRHIERIRELMVRHHDPRHVWITEVGWTVTTADGAPSPVTFDEQATYLVDMLWYAQQRYPWVQGVFVWNLNFRVIAAPNDEKTTFSLLDADWSLRPAFMALQHTVAPLRAIAMPPFVSPNAPYHYAWTFPGRGAMRFSPLHDERAGNQTLYAVSTPGSLYAIDPLSNTMRWEYTVAGIVRSMPAVAREDGTLYIGDSNSQITALDSLGTTLWTVRLRSPVRGSPIYANQTIYTVNEIGEVQAFDRAGKLVWQHDFASATTPLVIGQKQDALFLATATGNISKLSLDGNIAWQTNLHDECWAEPAPDKHGGVVMVTVRGRVVALDATGTIRWQTQVNGQVEAPPVVVQPSNGNATIYIASGDGNLMALAAHNGNMLWHYETGSNLVAPPMIDNNDHTIYIGTRDERLIALAPNGTLRWYAHLRGAVESAPLLTPDGMLYVTTTAGYLYAFHT